MGPELLPIKRDETGEHAGIVTVVLEQPGRPVIVLDHDLLQRLEATLKAIGAETRGLVLASASERSFVAGADLKTIREWDDDQLDRYLRYGAGVFAMLAQFPFPTAAAIGGAALGGGLELAMHCDGLIGAPSPSGKPYPIGLPEAGLGLCPGWGGTNLLPARMDPAEAIRRTASGQPLKFDEVLQYTLFSAAADSPGDLLDTAKAWVAKEAAERPRERDGAPMHWIGRPFRAPDVLKAVDGVRDALPDTEAARAVIDAVDAGLSKGWKEALDAERRHLVHLRGTETAKAAIDEFFARSAGKK